MTTTHDQDTSTEQLKKCVGNRLHLHFDMGEHASAVMAEKKAEQLLDKYYVGEEYRYSINAQAITIALMDGERTVGYRFSVEAWPFPDRGW